MCHSQGLKSEEKGEQVEGKSDLLSLLVWICSLRTPRCIKRCPETEKGASHVGGMGWKMRKWEDAQATSDGGGGSRGWVACEESREEKTGGMWRGRSGEGDVPYGFGRSLFQGKETQDEFQQSGKAAGILQVGTCCQRNVLQLCCSRFTAAWQITASFPDPQHPLLKIHFQSLLKVSDIGSDRANNFICVREMMSSHVVWSSLRGLMDHIIDLLLFGLHISVRALQLWNSLFTLNLCCWSC